MAAQKKTSKSSKAASKSAAAKKSISLKPPREKKAKAVKKTSSPARPKAAKKPSRSANAAAKAPKPVSLKERKKPAVSYGKSDLNFFRELIIEKIREANNELVSIEERLIDTTSGDYPDEDATYSMHMAEQGTDAMEREKAFLFASRERKFISHLEDAMQRIASGNYGICINCENLIDKGRLEAVPHARMCVNCKNDSKKGEHL